MTNGSVGVLGESSRHEAVQIIRNRTKGDRLISGRFLNSPSSRKDGTEDCLRLRVGARELQTKWRELAPYFSEKPRASGETADQKDKLFPKSLAGIRLAE